MMHFKPVVAISEAELRGHVYDFFHQEGYFPLTLKTGRPFRLDRQPIWPKSLKEQAMCVFHHPQLSSWPVVAMECDIRDNRLFFVIDHWKPEAWCKAQVIYADYDARPKLAQSMISDDPMRHANMGC